MKRTTLSPAVLGFLERDRIATLNIAGVLRNRPESELLVDDEENPRGVLVKGPWFWYVHTEDEVFLEALILEMEQRAGFYRFSGVWRPLAEKLKARFPLVWDAPCDLYYVPPGSQRSPSAAHSRVQRVELQDAERIDRHYAYRYPGSLEKIQKCIEQRNSSAVYVDGEAVCWLLVHEDDSLGIMYTLKEHRRKGYAVAVTEDLVRQQLASGRTPFLQIRDDNSMSPGLAGKCGFVKHGSCDWFGLVSGTPQELIEAGIASRRQFLSSLVPEERLVQRPGFRAVLSGRPGWDFLLDPCIGPEEMDGCLVELQALAASPLWITTPLDALDALVKTGRLYPEGESLCLYRFLVLLEPEPHEDIPVVEAGDEEAWLTFASRHFDGALLRTSLAGLRKDYRLLWELREGEIRAGAALLADDNGDFQLVWATSREQGFLRHVLLRAKTMGLDTVFAHVPIEEQAVFEGLGCRLLYTEKHFRLKDSPDA